MLYWLLGCLFVVGQFGLQSQASAGNPYYTCHAWGDPHLQTWRAHDTPLGHEHLQDCMANGKFPLVQNQYVNYEATLYGTYITDTHLTCYNPTTKQPVCQLSVINPEVLAQNEKQCSQNGVTWTLAGTSDFFTLILSFILNEGNFTITVQRQPSHCDVHLWQPHHWGGGSSGLCTHKDPKCAPMSRTSVPNTRTNILTYAQAQSICQAYMDAYLARSQQKRSVVLSSAVSSIMKGCTDDVMLTGDAESAKSGLNVLMMEELTSDVTSTDGIKQALEAGMAEGTSRVEEAAQEARMKVARFL